MLTCLFLGLAHLVPRFPHLSASALLALFRYMTQARHKVSTFALCLCVATARIIVLIFAILILTRKRGVWIGSGEQGTFASFRIA